MSNGYAIDVRDLHKSRGENKAVRGVSFRVRPGEIFSLLGPNGAGKSTTLAMLSGLLKPDGGDALLAGHSILRASPAARSAVGVVPQDIALYADLTALQNLHFWGKMYGLRGALLRQRSREMLEFVGLTDRRNDCVATFSSGMKRRLNISVALLHMPSILIMDEPTVGVDPQSRRHILDGILDLKERGTTILYTTHLIEEAAQLSQHIAIMDEGRIIASGTLPELLGLLGTEARIHLTATGVTNGLLEAWRNVSGTTPAKAPDGTWTMVCADSQCVVPELFEAAAREQGRITRVDVREPDLEAVFLLLTGRALRE